MKKTVGIIGGMGPIATSHFMELIIKMTDAKRDQDHLKMIIYNDPTIPDRTEYILDKTKKNPLPNIVKIGKKLENEGVDYLCMPCVTAHYFINELTSNFKIPIINMFTQTGIYLKNIGIKTVGLMATDGTISSGLFQKELENFGLRVILPSEENQKGVMHLIYENVKADIPCEMDVFKGIETELKKEGSQAIILGCTELSLIKRDNEIGKGFIDAMEVLAKKTVEVCGCDVKKEYDNLIS